VETAHERLRLWTADGTWDQILNEVIVKDDSVGDVEWIVSVDSSVVRTLLRPTQTVPRPGHRYTTRAA
jgi:hypothetical protein